MAFALPVWLAVQEELLGHEQGDSGTANCFDAFDDEELFKTFHLTRPCISFVTDSVRLRMKTLPLCKPTVTVDAAVMAGLNYYAHGVCSTAILQRLGLTQAECATILCAVSEVIAGMSDQFISFPITSDAKARVAFRIEKLCGIRKTLGVLAPAHFRVRASPYEKNTFRSFVNTLGYTSVMSQIICDSDGNILSVEKCCAGSTFEAEMWESSFKGMEIEKDLHGPFWVIGGKGYYLSKHVLTPISEPASDLEIRFNEAHAKIHNVMQTTLGTLKRRFRCLMQLGFAQKGYLYKKSNIIKSCCVLHNIAMKFSVPPPPIAGKIEPLLPGKQLSVPVEIHPDVLKAREKLIHDSFSVVNQTKTKITSQ